ncbi:MAG TPA: Bax inhibitor-1/YccA family protein [Bacilli bacterium]|nr:Bax inhibitor-1/YccA family protein [Bacilli bacterium]
MGNSINTYFNKIFFWMFIGLLITGVTGYFISRDILLLSIFLKGFYFFIIAEIIMVIAFASVVNKVKPTTAIIMFIIYALLNGITFSGIFAAYKLGSILVVLLSTSIFFILLALYGYFTKQDLTKFGIIMFIGLITVILVSIINFFLNVSGLEIILSIIIILIFLGLTAYDIQRLKDIYYMENNSDKTNIAIYGALELYLDFINIFIRLLSLFGRGRD